MTDPNAPETPISRGQPGQPVTPGSPTAQRSPNPDTSASKYTSLSSLINQGSPDPNSPTAKRGDNPAWRLPSTQHRQPRRSSASATGRPAQRRFGNGPSLNNGATDRRASVIAPAPKEIKRLSVWYLMALTVAQGGSQIAWTVELGYGTPYLLDLGLSEQLTSLVWLAGPISGLVVQPLIGAISDSSTSRYRRRFWIVASTALLVLSGLTLAFTEPIAKSLVDLFGGGQGDWDPRSAQLVKNTAIGIAVFCFYCLDFALNGLQASLRNLVFDVTPSEQLNSANAWNGRFNHIGNIVGFTLGFINLNELPVLSLLGGGQFRKLCVVSLIILIVTVVITCVAVEEDERPSPFGERRSKFRDVLRTVNDAVVNLPRPVRRICMVQIFAFMGWFPFLFYATTYVADVMAHEQGARPDMNVATRVGSFALLIHAFVAIIAGTVLPYLSQPDQRLQSLEPVDSDDEGDSAVDDPAARNREEAAELLRVREMVRQWKAEAAGAGRSLKLPHMPFMLRNIWTGALILFFLLMESTFVITNVWQAGVMISLVGICWAVACWVPFAIMMEFLKETEGQDGARDARSAESGSASRSRLAVKARGHRSHQTSPVGQTERTPLVRSFSDADIDGASLVASGQGAVAGGTIMGIHNLAIVFPQFVIALVASVIFRLADGEAGLPEASVNRPAYERTGTAWVLRFGGLCALIGAGVCRKVPPTKAEKAMRRRMAEIRAETEE